MKILPVPINETYIWERTEEIFYHNDIRYNLKWIGRLFTDKSYTYNNHKYKTIFYYKEAIVKDKYKDYQIALPSKIKYDEETILL